MLINFIVLLSCLCLTSCSIGHDNQPTQETSTPDRAHALNIIYLDKEIGTYRSIQDAFTSLTQKGNVVVDFYADWCGPCKSLAQSLEQAARAYPNITFLKINIDQFSAIADQYGIRSIPTLYFFKDGNKQTHVTGYKNAHELKTIIASVYK